MSPGSSTCPETSMVSIAERPVASSSSPRMRPSRTRTSARTIPSGVMTRAPCSTRSIGLGMPGSSCGARGSDACSGGSEPISMVTWTRRPRQPDRQTETRVVRALVLTAPDTFELRDLAPPELRDDNAVVRVELCGNCGTDIKYASGRLSAPLPMILGHEIVGRVEHIGPIAAARHRVAAGDRVILESSIPCWACPACRSGAYRLCRTKGGYGTRSGLANGSGLWGGLAEVVEVAPGSLVHRVPDGVSPKAAIAMELLANGYQWLVRQGGLRPGQRPLIRGCG